MTSITEENVKPEHAERYSGEIKDLLLVAQNQFFDDDAEVVREKEDFEKAAELRDQLKALEKEAQV